MSSDNFSFLVTTAVAKGQTETSNTTAPPTLSDQLFQRAVVVIGVVGMLANGFVGFVLITTGQLNKKHQTTNVFLLNQLMLDFYSCVLLTATYVVKLCNVQLVGPLGYWLCMLVISEEFVWIGIDGSMLNLGAIAVERCMKICHPLWHKVHLRQWMVYLTTALIWASGFGLSIGITTPTTQLVEGQCLALVFWPTKLSATIYSTWYFLSYYVVLIFVFGVCYGRIFVTVRRQQKIFPGSVVIGPLGDTLQQKQMQMKLFKMTFVLTLFFAVCWLPNQVYYLLLNIQSDGLNLLTEAWYGTLFFGFFNICTNPLIYGAKSELVKNYIRRVKDHFRETSATVSVKQRQQQQQQQQQSVELHFQQTSHD